MAFHRHAWLTGPADDHYRKKSVVSSRYDTADIAMVAAPAQCFHKVAIYFVFSLPTFYRLSDSRYRTVAAFVHVGRARNKQRLNCVFLDLRSSSRVLTNVCLSIIAFQSTDRSIC